MLIIASGVKGLGHPAKDFGLYPEGTGEAPNICQQEQMCAFRSSFWQPCGAWMGEAPRPRPGEQVRRLCLSPSKRQGVLESSHAYREEETGGSGAFPGWET